MKNLTKGGYSVEKPHFQHYLYSKTSLNQKQLPGEKKPIIFKKNITKLMIFATKYVMILTINMHV